MAVRDILILPDKRLRLKSEPVKAVDRSLRKLVDDMFETMYAAPGIGLAAIQLGVAQRVVTMDLAKKDDPKAPLVFINPEVIWESDETAAAEEGCLSIPEYYEEVERPAAVRVKYLDLDGRPQEIEASGLLATCLQHEIDHTNGVLFIDHISKLKRDRVIKKFIKQAKTPTLVYVGERDVECPAPQSMEYWHALHTIETPVKLVIYAGEGHHFHKPTDLEDLRGRVIDWFGHYLQEPVRKS